MIRTEEDHTLYEITQIDYDSEPNMDAGKQSSKRDFYKSARHLSILTTWIEERAFKDGFEGEFDIDGVFSGMHPDGRCRLYVPDPIRTIDVILDD